MSMLTSLRQRSEWIAFKSCVWSILEEPRSCQSVRIVFTESNDGTPYLIKRSIGQSACKTLSLYSHLYLNRLILHMDSAFASCYGNHADLKRGVHLASHILCCFHLRISLINKTSENKFHISGNHWGEPVPICSPAIGFIHIFSLIRAAKLFIRSSFIDQ